MPAKKKLVPDVPPPVYPLPDGVELTSAAQKEWIRFTRLLPLNRGPRLLFVLVDAPALRRRLADHLTTALHADGHTVARLDLAAPSYQPLQEIFDTAAQQPDARFYFLFGLERSLLSFEHRESALTDLNFHRDQIHRRLACPLVIWTTDEAFTDLANNAPDFIAWRSGTFTFADVPSVVEASYHQHVIDRFGKLTLYSVTSDAPLAVDLERVFVRLTAIQRRPRVQTAFPEPLRIGLTLPEPVVRTGKATGENRPLPPTPPSASPTRASQSPEREVAEEFTVTVSISEAFRSSLCLAIIGVPGAGKTTLLRYLALTYARHQARERLELDEERLPVFIALRDFNRFLDNAERRGELLDLSPYLLPRFLNEHLTAIAPHLHLPADLFEHALTKGRCAVLLDGLDEVADPLKRARAAEAVVTFVRHYRGNRFVVTSRPRGYEGEAKQRLSPFCADCTIRDFDDNDMAAFAHSWYEAVTRERLGDNPDAIAEARRQTNDLLRAIRADERVKALAHNPLLLSVLAMVHQRGVGLPQRRAELYDECTDLLLGYWDQTKGGEAARELATYGALSRSEKRALLEPVALWFHERDAQSLEADKAELEREISRQFQETFGDDEHKARRRAELFLRIIEERAGLLVEREMGVYAFAHLTFQEYLAARAIADRDDYIAYTLQHLHDPWWQEVILLEVGHLSDVRHFGRRARKLTSDLIRAIRNADSWLEEVLKRDLLLAARALADVGTLGVDDDLRQSLLDKLLSLWRTTRYVRQHEETVNVFTSYIGTANEERVVDELLQALQDKSVDVRSQAAEALGRIGQAAVSERVVSVLLQALRDEDWEVRYGAAEALGQMGQAAASEKVLSALLQALRDDDWKVRSQAAMALGRIGQAAASEKVLSALLQALQDESEGVRSQATMALGQMGQAAASEKVLSALLQALRDKDASMRSGAAEALGQIGQAEASESVLSALLQALQDENANVRPWAAMALGHMGQAAASEKVLSALLQALRDKDASMRSGAAEALGQIGQAEASESVLSALLQALHDENWGVRSGAAWALGQMGQAAASESVLSALLQALHDKDRDVRSGAARALGRIGQVAASEKVLSALLQALQDESEGVRSQAAEALGRIGQVAASERVLSALLQALRDESASVRSGAAEALGQMGQAEANEAVLGVLAKFWRSQLDATAPLSFGGRYGRACNIAFEQLWQMAGQRVSGFGG